MGRPGGLGRRRYSAEFRGRMVDVLAAGRKAADVAHDLGISEQTIYGWLRQEPIDGGLEPGLNTGEKAELAGPSGGSTSWKRSWRCIGSRPSC